MKNCDCLIQGGSAGGGRWGCLKSTPCLLTSICQVNHKNVDGEKGKWNSNFFWQNETQLTDPQEWKLLYKKSLKLIPEFKWHICFTGPVVVVVGAFCILNNSCVSDGCQRRKSLGQLVALRVTRDCNYCNPHFWVQFQRNGWSHPNSETHSHHTKQFLLQGSERTTHRYKLSLLLKIINN